MPIEFLAMPERRFGLLLLPDPERRKVRLLFRYKGDFRAMCWLQVGNDGSLYLNRRRMPVGPAINAVGVADGLGGASEYMWAEIESEAVQNRKVSHHASGIVTAGSTRSKSVSPRDVKESTLFRQMDYSHPSRFDVIEPANFRETDIVVPWFDGEPYELFDDQPLASRVWVAPLRGGGAQVPYIHDIDDAKKGQTGIVVPATGLKGCQDLTYQIQFFSQTGKWPEMDGILTLMVGDT
jgi:hypothetical protein